MSKRPMPGYDEEKHIHNGSNPKRVLRDRGVAYDGTGFVPEVPDYLGYVLGLMLLWLIFTGYNSVLGMIQNSGSAISKIGQSTVAMKDRAFQVGVDAKQTVKDAVLSSPTTKNTIEEIRASSNSRARLADAAIPDPEKGWAARQLDNLNDGVHFLAVYAADLLEGVFSDDDPGESRNQDRGYTKEPNSAPQSGGDSLDTF